MNIPRGVFRVLLWGSAIGGTLTGIKIITEAFGSGLWRPLNGWLVMFVFCVLMLIAVGSALFVERLNSRFAAVNKALAEKSEELGRATSGVGMQCDSRIGNIHQEFEAKLKKEAENRSAATVADRNRMSDMEDRITKLEKRSLSPGRETMGAELPLQDRLGALAREIFAFLAKCGREDEKQVPSITYLTKVHDGFMLQLHGSVERITYELGAAGVLDFRLGELLRVHENAFIYETIRQIGETLLAVKSKLELHEYQNVLLTQKDIDQMNSGEYRARLESDPEFAKQVEALSRFTQAGVRNCP